MKQYDLEERTALFSENIIDLCSGLIKNDINKNICNQLLRSATSVGANYQEANGASSKKDFKNKIHICKKEAKETEYWLRLLQKSCPANKVAINILRDESAQLILIFSKITSSLNKKLEN